MEGQLFWSRAKGAFSGSKADLRASPDIKTFIYWAVSRLVGGA
jgi:hypothetical protein